MKSDLSRVDGVSRNLERVKRLMRFYARFETMCMRDLRVFAEASNGNVYHYRDKSGLECDAVVHLRNGSYGLIEVKLGGDRLIEEGAENLKKLREKIDTTKMKIIVYPMTYRGAVVFS